MTDTKQGRFTKADELLADSLRTLSQLLAKHYGKKVIVLIDEYDVPLDKAFQGGYYTEMVTLIRNLFGNVLKTANSHFLRTAGPHFPDSPGHIKRTAWDISRAEGTPPH